MRPVPYQGTTVGEGAAVIFERDPDTNCPKEFEVSTPKLLMSDGTKPDACSLGEAEAGGCVQAVRDLGEMLVDLVKMGLKLGCQMGLCVDESELVMPTFFGEGPHTTQEEESAMLDLFLGKLSALSLRQLYQMTEGVLLFAVKALPTIYSLFNSGVFIDQNDVPYTAEETFKCLFQGDAFGKTGTPAYFVSYDTPDSGRTLVLKYSASDFDCSTYGLLIPDNSDGLRGTRGGRIGTPYARYARVNYMGGCP